MQTKIQRHITMRNNPSGGTQDFKPDSYDQRIFLGRIILASIFRGSLIVGIFLDIQNNLKIRNSYII